MNNGFPGPNPTETVTGGKTLELTKYDKIRRPHKLIIDDTKIKITSRTLSAELCCPICLDLLTCTMTSECLHRFCSECITTALMRGNKECPTCRKKIISKRSLRPDPNFDFLISKIWPDRKQYDVECNASMQLFQKQSNVLSLQRSIQEGIRAQAAYRKQRVQGSYDYEKRRRRPKTTVVNSDCQQQCEELSTRSIEHLTVSLTPAVYLDHEIDERCSESPMEYSCDDSGSSSDTADSSSLTSDSSISSTSSTSTNKASIQRPFSIVEDGNQYEENIENNLEHMAEEMRRRGDELEIELAPSNAFINRGMVLPSLSTSHYIRISSEITIAVLIEFLLQLANQTSDCPLHKQLMDANSSNHTTISLHSDIKLFFIDRYHRLCIIDPSEYLATIFFNSINWDRHLTIFYDINSPNDSNFELKFVIGDELAKNIERYVKAESHNINAKTEVNCESSEASAKTINSEVSHEEQVQSNIDCKPKESKFELED